MTQKTEPQLLLEDWVEKREAGQKRLLADKTQSARDRAIKSRFWESRWSAKRTRRADLSNYRIWKAMRQRCLNPTANGFPYYGGRGISICERWNDFETFAMDMGPRPSKNHSLDRKDSNGNYSPENCQWATRLEQATNTRSNLIFSHQGRSLVLSQWARELGIPYKRLYNRIHGGMSFENAIKALC